MLEQRDRAGAAPRHERWWRTAMAVAVLVLGTLAGGSAPVRTQVAGAAYSVDCAVGNDMNSGMSEAAAWRTLARANQAPLLPRRGCTFAGPLHAAWVGTAEAPIAIGAYGEGERPVIWGGDAQGNVVKIAGSHVVVDGRLAARRPGL